MMIRATKFFQQKLNMKNKKVRTKHIGRSKVRKEVMLLLMVIVIHNSDCGINYNNDKSNNKHN